MVMLEHGIGDGFSALDAQAGRDKLDGYAVVSGLGVSVDSGLTLSVASGTATVGETGGSVDTVSLGSATTVTLNAADSTHPRKDTIYIDTAGTVQVETGTASAADPTGNERFATYEPAPPLPSADGTVLAEVWVPAGASSLSSADVRDRRVPADVVGERGVFDSLEADSLQSGASFLQHPSQSNDTITGYVDAPMEVIETIDYGATFITGVGVRPDGTLWVMVADTNEIQHIKRDGTVLDTIDISHIGDTFHGASEDPDDGGIWVSCENDASLGGDATCVKVDQNGTRQETIALPEANARPRSPTIDPSDGSVWVGVKGTNTSPRILHLARDGTVLDTIAIDWGQVEGPGLDHETGLLWTSSAGLQEARQLTRSGDVVRVVEWPTDQNPIGPITDPFDGSFWVVDWHSDNNRILHIAREPGYLADFQGGKRFVRRNANENRHAPESRQNAYYDTLDANTFVGDSMDVKRQSQGWIFPAKFDGATATDRLSNAISAAAGGEAIMLEAASYDSMTFTDRVGLINFGNIWQPGTTEIASGETWTFDDRAVLMGIDVQGSVEFNQANSLVERLILRGGATADVNANSVMLSKIVGAGEVVFASGTEGGYLTEYNVSFSDPDGNNNVL